LTARFAAARQSAKDTPATTGFITGIMHRSYLYPDYNYITSGPEHSGGAVARPTARKGNDYRQSYVHLFGGEGRMYPALVGVLLLGLIFNILNFENGRGSISLSAYWQSVIRGTFLLVVVIVQSRLSRRRS
jgi:hypothetical protein